MSGSACHVPWKLICGRFGLHFHWICGSVKGELTIFMIFSLPSHQHGMALFLWVFFNVGILQLSVLSFLPSDFVHPFCIYPKIFPGGSDSKESACNAGDLGSVPGLRKIPWRSERLPTPVFWPGEFYGLYSPWGHKESDTTEQLSLQGVFLEDATVSKDRVLLVVHT